MSVFSSQKQSQNIDFPNLRPSLDLRFALAKKLDPRVTFTRASTGTYFGPDGLIKTAAVNEPRFDYDPISGECKGLLIEESRVNLLTYSADYSNSFWTKTNATIFTNSAVSPLGDTSANFLQETTQNGVHRIFNNTTIISANTTYTFSFFAKPGGRNFCYAELRDSTGNIASIRVNLINGSIGIKTGLSQSVTTLPNGWFCVSITATTSVSHSGAGTYIIYADNGSNNQYQGDGTSGIYIWGAQLEAGAFPTSYIPTSGGQGTRNPDLASMDGTNFSSWYNQTEGSIYLSAIPYYSSAVNAFNRLISINDGSGAQRNTIQVVTSNILNQIACSFWYSSVFQFGFNKVIITGTRFKVAFSIASNNCAGSFDGVARGRDFSVIIPTMNKMYIGSYNNNYHYMTMHISRLTYYPVKLTDQQLLNLTS